MENADEMIDKNNFNAKRKFSPPQSVQSLNCFVLR